MYRRRPRVDIIISTYNAGAFLEACLANLVANTKWPHNVIITDDCSTEGRLLAYLDEIANSHQSTVTVLKSDIRRGFAGNNAWAVEQTKSRYFCLLNQDTEPQELWLTHMMETMRSDKNIGIVGAKLLFPPGKDEVVGTIQHAGVGRTTDGSPYHPYREKVHDFPQANVLREVNAVTGACMLVRRKCWDELEGFDQRYSFGQFEDCDLCWRARKLGWRIMVQPEAVLFHFEHGCGELSVHEGHDKNRALLLETWHDLEGDEILFPGGAQADYKPQ